MGTFYFRITFGGTLSKICLLIDRPSISGFAEGQKLSGNDLHFIEEKMRRAGIAPSQLTIESVTNEPRTPLDADYSACANRLNSVDYDIIIPCGEKPLQFITGKHSIWKWHLSPLDTLGGLACRRAVPTFTTEQIRKEWHLGLYFEMALRRARIHAGAADSKNADGTWKRKPANYLLSPPIDQCIATLESIRHLPAHSIDIETGRNQINTFGVAWTGSDAIAIKVLPDGMSAATHHRLWELIRQICESDSEKILQNNLYERLYLSRYGIHIRGKIFDTMIAQKFLWPELEKGLDNVGRIYTMEPYWKDDGRVASAEGKQKDWGNIRDWPRHFDYNCKDTTNTLIASIAQKADMRARGLEALYDNYIRRLFDSCYEMGARGLPLNPERQKQLIADYEEKSASLLKQLSKPDLNPRSSKQKIKFLQDKGLKLPKKKDHKKGGMRDSSDALTLKKLRVSYPEDNDIKILLEIAGIEKALSSYLRVRTFPDNRIRFSLDAHGTETGRMSCNKDPWDRGFNAQTMTDYVKQMIEWKPEEDRVFIEFDLEQAETRFVAYDAVEENLLGMLERKEDIHSYVAAEIFGCTMSDVLAEVKAGNPGKRQLGKKSGHGANYNMGVTTFIDSCLKEMDLVLDRKMATRTLEAYHKLFPGIRKWHARIRSTVYRERRLSNPLGRVRYFYGRADDNTYREAYAYRPQSTVPDIANHLKLALKNQRTEGAFDFWLHLQVHDSVMVSCKRDQVEKISKFALNTALWHPEIILPAGKLIIPTSAKFGACLGEMQKLKI